MLTAILESGTHPKKEVNVALAELKEKYARAQQEPEKIPKHQEHAGCDRCWPESPDQAWDALPSLVVEKELVDESHFMVKIRCCPVCSQRFVSVFTELIDWSDGEDPQSWIVLPISQSEALKLEASKSITTDLNVFASDRRSLRHEHPKGSGAHTFWGAGILVGPHD